MLNCIKRNLLNKAQHCFLFSRGYFFFFLLIVFYFLFSCCFNITSFQLIRKSDSNILILVYDGLWCYLSQALPITHWGVNIGDSIGLHWYWYWYRFNPMIPINWFYLYFLSKNNFFYKFTLDPFYPYQIQNLAKYRYRPLLTDITDLIFFLFFGKDRSDIHTSFAWSTRGERGTNDWLCYHNNGA